jgi:hypothetical protein
MGGELAAYLSFGRAIRGRFRLKETATACGNAIRKMLLDVMRSADTILVCAMLMSFNLLSATDW